MKNDDRRKGIWIPIELVNNKDLNWPNKVLLAEIYYLNKLPSGCFASNDFFANLLGTERSAASKRISYLKKNGYIQTEDIFHKGQCVGRVITPLINCESYDDYIKVSSQSKGRSSQMPEEIPEQPGEITSENPEEVPESFKNTAIENPEKVLEQPEGTSVENQGVVPERPGGSSLENQGVVP